jgi:antitoxin ParD1/3/4
VTANGKWLSGENNMNVSLTHEWESWLQQRVESGLYDSPSEVIRESLRLLRERDEQRQAMVEDLRAEVLLGARQLDAGKSHAFTNDLVQQIKNQGREVLLDKNGSCL